MNTQTLSDLRHSFSDIRNKGVFQKEANNSSSLQALDNIYGRTERQTDIPRDVTPQRGQPDWIKSVVPIRTGANEPSRRPRQTAAGRLAPVRPRDH